MICYTAIKFGQHPIVEVVGPGIPHFVMHLRRSAISSFSAEKSLSRIGIELPSVAYPLSPCRWGKLLPGRENSHLVRVLVEKPFAGRNIIGFRVINCFPVTYIYCPVANRIRSEKLSVIDSLIADRGTR